MSNRRQHYREIGYRSALMHLPDSDEAPVDCTVIDQSPGGMRILAAKHIATGAVVEVLLEGQSFAGEIRFSAPRPMGQCELGLQFKEQPQ